jgi:hypothetical protein
MVDYALREIVHSYVNAKYGYRACRKSVGDVESYRPGILDNCASRGYEYDGKSIKLQVL